MNCIMASLTKLTKRSTVYFNPDMHRALKLKSLKTSRSISVIVDEALTHKLRESREDIEDLLVFKDREHEPNISFESVVASLKDEGKI